ncbi:hypothetical protein [Aliikangiella sp. G2MR2-5]|uniref:hypothetical protein n=1 Tax=Aliikangiella sp. G2MR2-5 TaxID=2788943 RepID=UPI0018A8E58F|nr:hypothetical protein [Aliikangiella sp. G2MR2-5]
MIQVIEDSSEQPICPYCEKDINRVNASKVKSLFGVRYLYSCGHCRKVLGVSHRKGFWMG